MPNDITPNHTNGALISNDLKKMLLVPVMALVGSFGVSYFTTQRQLDQLEFQAQVNKENITANAAGIKANAEATNQLVISMARTSEALTRVASDLKEIQIEMRTNNSPRR
jgi:hypothetical protein